MLSAFDLFAVVEEHGGFEEVARQQLWSLVARRFAADEDDNSAQEFQDAYIAARLGPFRAVLANLQQLSDAEVAGRDVVHTNAADNGLSQQQTPAAAAELAAGLEAGASAAACVIGGSAGEPAKCLRPALSPAAAAASGPPALLPAAVDDAARLPKAGLAAQVQHDASEAASTSDASGAAAGEAGPMTGCASPSHTVAALLQQTGSQPAAGDGGAGRPGGEGCGAGNGESGAKGSGSSEAAAAGNAGVQPLSPARAANADAKRAHQPAGSTSAVAGEGIGAPAAKRARPSSSSGGGTNAGSGGGGGSACCLIPVGAGARAGARATAGAPPHRFDSATTCHVECGTASGVYVMESGHIICSCSACKEQYGPGGGRMMPSEFERHGGNAACKKWRYSIKVTGPPMMPLGRWLDMRLAAQAAAGRQLLPAHTEAAQASLGEQVQGSCHSLRPSAAHINVDPQMGPMLQLPLAHLLSGSGTDSLVSAVGAAMAQQKAAAGTVGLVGGRGEAAGPSQPPYELQQLWLTAQQSGLQLLQPMPPMQQSMLAGQQSGPTAQQPMPREQPQQPQSQPQPLSQSHTFNPAAAHWPPRPGAGLPPGSAPGARATGIAPLAGLPTHAGAPPSGSEQGRAVGLGALLSGASTPASLAPLAGALRAMASGQAALHVQQPAAPAPALAPPQEPRPQPQLLLPTHAAPTGSPTPMQQALAAVLARFPSSAGPAAPTASLTAPASMSQAEPAAGANTEMPAALHQARLALQQRQVQLREAERCGDASPKAVPGDAGGGAHGPARAPVAEHNQQAHHPEGGGAAPPAVNVVSALGDGGLAGAGGSPESWGQVLADLEERLEALLGDRQRCQALQAELAATKAKLAAAEACVEAERAARQRTEQQLARLGALLMSKLDTALPGVRLHTPGGLPAHHAGCQHRQHRSSNNGSRRRLD